MKVLSTEGLTKLIQLIKSSFISTSNTVTTNTVTLADVATSGDFNDLINQPTIPTVGNGTITINQGGTQKGTFTLNQSGNATINLDAGGGTPSNMVTTDTVQDITAKKTFIGDKAINFKQATTADKLGFTLFSNTNSELAAFEFRPSTIGSSALFNLNLSKTSANYVGFRYHGTNAINVACPKVATAGNYYIPINFTDGTNTVNADNKGSVNISSLLPSIDSSLDKNSTNPVQNKAIAEAIEDISLAKNPNLNLIGGSLNIDSGNVSGFSTTNYMQFPFVFNFNGYTWTLEMGFTTGSDVTTQQNILDSYYGVAFAINNGKFLMALSSNGSSWDIGSTSGAYSVQANTAYSVKIAWDGTNYTLSYALDETNYTTDITISSSALHYSTQEYVGGEPELFGSGSQHPFTGTINLNKWNLIVNGLEVWLGMDDVGLGSRANVDLSNLTEAGLSMFQAPLVSGTNIKTVNNTSILGSGDISIPIVTVDQTFDGTSANAQSGVAIAGKLADYVLSDSSNSIDIYSGTSIGFNAPETTDITANGLPIITSYNILSNDAYLTIGEYSNNYGIYLYDSDFVKFFYAEDGSSGLSAYSSNRQSHYAIDLLPSGISFGNEDYTTTITVPSDGSLALNGHNIITDNNLKTINNQSILGSGNIDIQGGVSMTYNSLQEKLTWS